MKKRIYIVVGGIVAAALAVGPMAAANAAQTEVLGSGSAAGGVVIDETRAATGSSTGSARAGDASFWQWGVGKDDTWSNHFRERSCHGATAVGKKTKRVTGVAGGRYAMAMTPKKSSGNQAYWHVC